MHVVIACLYCLGSTTSSGSGSEHSNSGNSDEALLESFFSNLAAFRFEQARECCVRIITMFFTCYSFKQFCAFKLKHATYFSYLSITMSCCWQKRL